MKTLARCTVAALVLAAATAFVPAASARAAQMEDKPGQPLASPVAMASVTIGGKALVIHYNAPSSRTDRSGALAPTLPPASSLAETFVSVA
jgi:hypothetical protein